MNILVYFSYIFGFVAVILFINNYDERRYKVISEETGSSQLDFKLILSYFFIFICIVLGMAATTLFDILNSGDLIKLDGFRLQFLASIMVSPIVMRLTLKDISVINFSTFLNAFQNGFFWQTIFDKLS